MVAPHRQSRSRLGVFLLLAVLLASGGALGAWPGAVHQATARTHQGTRPAATAGVADLFGVTCPSARICYAVGYYGVRAHDAILVTTDGARTWHPQAPGLALGLRAVACPTVRICYAVGYGQTVLRTTNGGQTWRQTQPLGFQALGGVACPTVATCYAVGVSDRYDTLYHRIVRLARNGQAALYPATPIDATTFPLAAIACPTASVCYAVGSAATILVTHDGGQTWQQQHNPALDGAGIRPPLSGIACASVSTCVVVGGFPGSPVILATTTGGHSWTWRTSPTRAALFGVACPTRTTCDAVGEQGGGLRTTDGGQTWASREDSGHLDGLTAIACHGAGFCVVVGTFGLTAVLGQQQHTPPVPHGPLSLQIVHTTLFYEMDGPEYRTDIPLAVPTYFQVSYALANAGAAVPTASISFIKNGQTIASAPMRLLPAGHPYYAQSEVQFTSAALLGPVDARITLRLRSLTASTVLHFTVVTNPTLPRATPDATPNATPPPVAPTATPGGSSGGKGQGCSAWNLSGSWTFTASSTSNLGSGSGPATITQSGTALGGTLTLAGTSYTFTGSITGTAVTLTLKASGQADTSLSGVLAPDGRSIDVGQGVFQGQATCTA